MFNVRLTLGALAALESQLEQESLIQLIERLSSDKIRSNDIISVLNAGLYGGGICDKDVRDHFIEGGAAHAAIVAQRLIVAGLGNGL